MPQNGYWIECIPVETGNNDLNTSEDDCGLYRAAIASIPEASVLATSPDSAIEELRNKLAALRHDYCTRGKNMPEHDNPVSPPRNPRSTKGWISVYVKMNDCCKTQT